MRKAVVAIRKFAIFCHRWMGVMFCLLFAWWFVSGIFMMYTDFPGVTQKERLARAQPINGSIIRVSPKEAWGKLGLQGAPASAQLAMFDGRPVYRFTVGGGRAGGGRGRGRGGRGGNTVVYADDATVQRGYSSALLLRIASEWAGMSAGTAKVREVTATDQWTVGGALRNLRPLWKYTFPDGQQVYVNGNTGAVAQYTTTRSRLLAELGPIPHWLYYTPLRVQQKLWTEIVIWTSGVATFVALLGLVVGIWMYSPSKRYRFRGNPAGVPYTGQKRLHMILGLFFGIVACTWAFSGMLSMDPFPSLVERGSGAGAPAARQINAALRPGDFHLEDYAAKTPQVALAETEGLGVRELTFTSFNGAPIYMATTGAGDTRIIPIYGVPRTAFTKERIFDIVEKAVAPAEVVEKTLLTQYDLYYLDRDRERPLPVLLVRIGDADHSRFYIDQRTGQIVAQHSDQSSFTTRWLYHGLHSLNFPWLYNYRPAWDIVVLILMLGGLAVCVTSVIVAGQVLGRKARSIRKLYGQARPVAGSRLAGQSRTARLTEANP